MRHSWNWRIGCNEELVIVEGSRSNGLEGRLMRGKQQVIQPAREVEQRFFPTVTGPYGLGVFRQKNRYSLYRPARGPK